MEYLDEDITALPMRDILNRLERYLIIPSADEWTYIRELRNEISHDYPLLEDVYKRQGLSLCIKLRHCILIKRIITLYHRIRNCSSHTFSN